MKLYLLSSALIPHPMPDANETVPTDRAVEEYEVRFANMATLQVKKIRDGSSDERRTQRSANSGALLGKCHE